MAARAISYRPQVNGEAYQTLHAEKHKLELELHEVAQKIRTIAEKTPRHLSGYLDDEMLPEELHNPLQRKYTILSFNRLTDAGNDFDWQALKQDEDSLYEYHGGSRFELKPPLAILQPLADEYMGQHSYYHFGVVVENIKMLADRNLSSLQSGLLEKKGESLKFLLKAKLGEIRLSEEKSAKMQEVLAKGAAHYGRGNFDFIADPMSCRNLQNGFDAIEKAGLWDKMPKDSTRESMDLLTKDPEFKKNVIDVIDAKDGHSGMSMHWTLKTLIELNKLGWEAFRNEWIARS